MGRPRREVPLVRTFLSARVLTLEQLGTRLECSRSTLLRRLKEHGYWASYNHSGRFLTIQEVAEFDAHGLWLCKAARFSRHGTLKDTAEHFVQSSQRGVTHAELAARLGVRVHNALLELIGEDRLRRERLGPTFVYFSRKRSVQKQQMLRRKSFLREHQKPRPSGRQIIAALVEVIKNPTAERKEIVLGCQRAGVAISPEGVDAIFERYELDKKRAP